MVTKVLVLLLLVAFSIIAHASKSQKFEKIVESRNRAGQSEFDYDDRNGNGPEHWGEISPKYAMCKKGHHQSPINLDIARTSRTGIMPEVRLFESVIEYAPSGKNFALKCLGAPRGKHCSIILYKGEDYHMVQAHFHSPSEHHINGVAYPLEMHLVHAREDGKALLVLSVLFSLGEFNYDVQKLLDAAHEQNKQVVDFPHFIQPGAGLCTYEGSLTTPPCTEGVHWVISNTDVHVSLKQVGQYREMVGEHTNNRPVQDTFEPQAKCYLDPKFTGGIAKRPKFSSFVSRSGPLSQSSSVAVPSSNAVAHVGVTAVHSTPSDKTDSSIAHSATSESSITNSGTVSKAPIEIIPVSNVNVPNEDSSPGVSLNHSKSDSATLASPVPLIPLFKSSSSSCFPSDSKVRHSDGRILRMDELKIGDEVSIGDGKFSRIFLFTHRDPFIVTTHVYITLVSGKTLTLSPGHHISANGKLIAAGMVQVGDTLIGESGDIEMVDGILFARADGLYNPQTVSGNISVNRIVCSTYTTAIDPLMAHALLGPIRTLFRFGYVSEERTGKMFSNGVRL